MEDHTIITMRNVTKVFGGFTAVDNMSLELREGEFFSLLGPSGCGKTTALRMIAGFQEPSQGHIHIDGQDMSGIPANKRPTNMVFQSYAIFPHLRVGDNVAYGLRSKGTPRGEIAGKVANALEMVGLGGLEKRRANELSGGQRQRVALARALVMEPRVLLLDEPLSALDKKLREQMQFEMRRLQRNLGITFVMVTHDQYEAMTMSDRIGVMFEGRLEQVDSPQNLYARPATVKVASFVGEMNFLQAKLTSQQESTITMECAAFGTLVVPRNPYVDFNGTSRMVGIRPEQLEIGKTEPPDYDATVKGTVRDVAFYGENVHYHVTLEGVDAPVAVSVPNYFHTVDFNQGDAVWLGLQAASAIDLGQA